MFALISVRTHFYSFVLRPKHPYVFHLGQGNEEKKCVRYFAHEREPNSKSRNSEFLSLLNWAIPNHSNHLREITAGQKWTISHNPNNWNLQFLRPIAHWVTSRYIFLSTGLLFFLLRIDTHRSKAQCISDKNLTNWGILSQWPPNWNSYVIFARALPFQHQRLFL